MIFKKYTFIGADDSLGLEKGKSYYIHVMHYFLSGKILAWIKINETRIITCPYSSNKKFKENWRKEK